MSVFAWNNGSDSADAEQRTQPPLAQRLRDALAAGHVPKSEIFSSSLHAILTLGVVLAMSGVVTRAAMVALGDALRLGVPSEVENAERSHAGHGLVQLLVLCGAVVALVLAAGVVAKMLPRGPVFSPGAIGAGRGLAAMDPVQNIANALAPAALAALAARCLGVALFLAAAVWLGWSQRVALDRVMLASGGVDWLIVRGAILKVLGGVLGLGVVVGAFDYWINTRRWHAALRVTPREAMQDQHAAARRPRTVRRA